MLLIPAIDLRDGGVVRLYQGRFDRSTEYDVTPKELATRYAQAGARLIHVVDLDGARIGGAANLETIAELAGIDDLGIQTGGGIRTPADVDRLLALGVKRVVIGSLAVTDCARVCNWLQDYGPDRIVIALDVHTSNKNEPRVAINAWTRTSELTLWDAVDRLLDGGLRHVLCTDIGRDGALRGPNLSLYRQCVERYPSVAWQASGGIRSAADLHALADTGVTAAISGKALIEERIAIEELGPFLLAA